MKTQSTTHTDKVWAIFDEYTPDRADRLVCSAALELSLSQELINRKQSSQWLFEKLVGQGFNLISAGKVSGAVARYWEGN